MLFLLFRVSCEPVLLDRSTLEEVWHHYKASGGAEDVSALNGGHLEPEHIVDEVDCLFGIFWPGDVATQVGMCFIAAFRAVAFVDGCRRMLTASFACVCRHLLRSLVTEEGSQGYDNAAEKEKVRFDGRPMVRGDAILYRVCLPPSQSGAIALWNRAIYLPHKTTTGIVAIGGLEIPPPCSHIKSVVKADANAEHMPTSVVDIS